MEWHLSLGCDHGRLVDNSKQKSQSTMPQMGNILTDLVIAQNFRTVNVRFNKNSQRFFTLYTKHGCGFLKPRKGISLYQESGVLLLFRQNKINDASWILSVICSEHRFLHSPPAKIAGRGCLSCLPLPSAAAQHGCSFWGSPKPLLSIFRSGRTAYRCIHP